MANNFDIIKSYMLSLDMDGYYLHAQIVRRQKDHSNKVKEGALKHYYIRSVSELEKLESEIIDLANHYKARVYINLSRKSLRELGMRVSQEILSKNLMGQDINPNKLMSSVSGSVVGKDIAWIIDVDDLGQKASIYEYLRNHQVPVLEVPSASGLHLIALAKFNVSEVASMFGVDIHKNSMGSLLYFN